MLLLHIVFKKIKNFCTFWIFASSALCATEISFSDAHFGLNNLKPTATILCTNHTGVPIEQSEDLQIIQSALCDKGPINCRFALFDLEDKLLLNPSALYGLPDMSLLSLQNKYHSEFLLIMTQTLDKNWMIQAFLDHTTKPYRVFIEKDNLQSYAHFLEYVLLKNYLPLNSPKNYFFEMSIPTHMNRADILRFATLIHKNKAVENLQIREISDKKITFEVLAFWSPKQYELAKSYCDNLFINLD